MHTNQFYSCETRAWKSIRKVKTRLLFCLLLLLCNCSWYNNKKLHHHVSSTLFHVDFLMQYNSKQQQQGCWATFHRYVYVYRYSKWCCCWSFHRNKKDKKERLEVYCNRTLYHWANTATDYEAAWPDRTIDHSKTAFLPLFADNTDINLRI
jgi:hypothetical protein